MTAGGKLTFSESERRYVAMIFGFCTCSSVFAWDALTMLTLCCLQSARCDETCALRCTLQTALSSLYVTQEWGPTVFSDRKTLTDDKWKVENDECPVRSSNHVCSSLFVNHTLLYQCSYQCIIVIALCIGDVIITINIHNVLKCSISHAFLSLLLQLRQLLRRHTRAAAVIQEQRAAFSCALACAFIKSRHRCKYKQSLESFLSPLSLQRIEWRFVLPLHLPVAPSPPSSCVLDHPCHLCCLLHTRIPLSPENCPHFDQPFNLYFWSHLWLEASSCWSLTRRYNLFVVILFSRPKPSWITLLPKYLPRMIGSLTVHTWTVVRASKSRLVCISYIIVIYQV